MTSRNSGIFRCTYSQISNDNLGNFMRRKQFLSFLLILHVFYSCRDNLLSSEFINSPGTRNGLI